jgi:GT2 family glycosyltransferase
MKLGDVIDPAAMIPDEGCSRISVIICSRTRPEMVSDCVESLLRSGYGAFEIVIVDNTAGGELVAKAWTDERIRVIHEPKQGLSRARNTGVRAARYDIMAFIDDDVIVDPGWLMAVATTLNDDGIAGVTGLVVPLALDTRAEREFEWYGGMGKGSERRVFRGSSLSGWRTLRIQDVGVGANMIFRRSVFKQVGGFDEALGAGTMTLGSEDLDFFHRVLRHGLTVCYEPSARVSHRHRRTIEELRAQVGANGCAYGVYLMKIWSCRTVARTEVTAFAVWWLAERVATLLFRAVARPGLRFLLAWDECRGILRAPRAYRLAYRLL